MQKGFALITVLAALIMILLGTAAILNAVSGHMNMKANLGQEIKAQYLAEAGMQYALWICRENGGDCSAVPNTVTLEGETVEFTVNEEPLGSNRYTILVTVDYTDV